MAETRRCERCGKEFEPKREHARFCSARCRVAWNRENWNQVNQGPAEVGQRELGRRAARPAGHRDERAALGLHRHARHHRAARQGQGQRPGAGVRGDRRGRLVGHDRRRDAGQVLPGRLRHRARRGCPAAAAAGDEATFAGLRFVRNRMGYHADHADFIQPCRRRAAGGDAPITEWTWRSLPAPAVATLPPRGQEWELSRYQAYQDLLAGRPRRRDLRPDLRLP